MIIVQFGTLSGIKISSLSADTKLYFFIQKARNFLNANIMGGRKGKSFLR